MSRDSLDARRARWRAFMRPDAEPGFMFRLACAELSVPPRPLLWPERTQERSDWALTMYEQDMAGMAALGDDALPHLRFATGTEIFAEAFGCQVVRPTDTNPFALPLVHTAAEADALKVPELSASPLAKLFDLGDELRRRAGPDALMSLVDIQSPMDIAALIWEKASFYVAMVDTPEAVRQLAHKVSTLLMAFLDEFFRRYGTEYIAHYPAIFMPGGITLSEDEVGIVTADMFAEFFRHELVELSGRYGGIGMHCCADARHQWPHFRSIPNLRYLNLCKPPTRSADYVRDAYGFFDERVVQVHYGWTPDGPPETWPSAAEFRNRRVVWDIGVKTVAEGQALCDRLNAQR
ncbi:MAG: uroporphyrinogen decarboxylase family protein [Kiritimatiellae bacterium]|nr:uroporphyrinogen decarboxylase family protein [Kiritimatiellia bacterium]